MFCFVSHFSFNDCVIKLTLKGSPYYYSFDFSSFSIILTFQIRTHALINVKY